jgi:hypothetical protein
MLYAVYRMIIMYKYIVKRKMISNILEIGK